MDASNIRYGDILKQVKDDKKKVVAFIFKHWNLTKQNYSTIKKEIYAFPNFIAIC